MQTKRFSGSLSEFRRVLKKDLNKIKRHVSSAAQRTAHKGRKIAQDKAPKAFETLADGIVTELVGGGARIRSTAPYSAAVELGSRPHRPPFAPILAWVRLRGMQGLDAGLNATGHPASVMTQISAQGDGKSTPADAAHTVAWAIVHAITKNGTKPTHWMFRTAQELSPILDAFVKQALEKPL